MRGAAEYLRHQVPRLIAIVIVVASYGFAQLPTLPNDERAVLVSHFRFARAPLPELVGYPRQSVRAVNPSLNRISAWISSVGAAVALHDLDQDGLANDVCYVDTRINQVVVAPVPGTPARYAPFALSPAPLPYDPATMAPMGCLPGDLNEDGQTDILVYYWGRTPIAFLSTAAAGTMGAHLKSDGYVRREVAPGGARWFSNAATLADLDGDGHIDLVIGNYFPDGARVLDATATDQEQMQHSMSRAFNGGEKHLLLWSGATSGADATVRFTEAQGVFDEETNHGWTLAVGAADLDGDLLPELYFANDFGPDRLLYNRSTPGHLRFTRLEGATTLTTPSSKVLGHDSFKGMGVDFGDLNGDGLLDIFVSNITSSYALEESNFAFISTGETSWMQTGIAPYVDRSEPLGLSRAGWGWDARLSDFDNDGVLEAQQALGFVQGTINRWPELQELAMSNDDLLSNPGNWPRFQPGIDLAGHQHNPFFVRADSGRYYDIAADIGIADPQVSRGIATADVDGDGRLDFATANQWEPSAFFHNTSPDPGSFLGLHLLIPLQPAAPLRVRAGHPGADTLGYPAIGATASVRLSDGRRLVAEVDGGNGHSGKRSPDLQFGLGKLTDAQIQVELRWRDRAGRIHEQTLALAPGWHTVVLGS
jgi:hypothetical protein